MVYIICLHDLRANYPSVILKTGNTQSDTALTHCPSQSFDSSCDLRNPNPVVENIQSGGNDRGEGFTQRSGRA